MTTGLVECLEDVIGQDYAGFTTLCHELAR